MILKIAYGNYFHDIIKIFDLDNISIEENSYTNISVYDISCKTLFGAKALHIRFSKLDRSTRDYDGIRYSVLFGPEKCQKSGITYIISNTFPLMKIDSYNPLPLGKTLILDNVIMLIKLVFKKDQNHY